MKNLFAVSLTLIGAAIGFIFGMTVTFAMNSSSSLVLIGLSILFAIIGGVGLAKITPYFDSLDVNIQKTLTILCAVIAVILLLFVITTIIMLNSYYQLY